MPFALSKIAVRDSTSKVCITLGTCELCHGVRRAALPCMVQCPPIPPYHFVLLCVLEGSMCRHKGIGMNRPKKSKVEVPQFLKVTLLLNAAGPSTSRKRLRKSAGSAHRAWWS